MGVSHLIGMAAGPPTTPGVRLCGVHASSRHHPVLAGSSQSEVAHTYGVSQGWISRLARYRAEGEAAFEPRSRDPLTSPNATATATVELVLRLRKQLSDATFPQVNHWSSGLSGWDAESAPPPPRAHKTPRQHHPPNVYTVTERHYREQKKWPALAPVERPLRSPNARARHVRPPLRPDP